MSVKIRGLNKLLEELELRLGKDGMQRISDQALMDAAKEFVKVLKEEISSRPDKGFSEGGTIEEIDIFGPVTDKKGIRTIIIRWRGPRERYRIIHLNEWGTINNPGPPRKGAIALAMKKSEKAYRDAVRKALRSGL